MGTIWILGGAEDLKDLGAWGRKGTQDLGVYVVEEGAIESHASSQN